MVVFYKSFITFEIVSCHKVCEKLYTRCFHEQHSTSSTNELNSAQSASRKTELQIESDL